MFRARCPVYYGTFSWTALAERGKIRVQMYEKIMDVGLCEGEKAVFLSCNIRFWHKNSCVLCKMRTVERLLTPPGFSAGYRCLCR